MESEIRYFHLKCPKSKMYIEYTVGPQTHSALIYYNADSMPRALDSSLYQLAYGTISFVTCFFI